MKIKFEKIPPRFGRSYHYLQAISPRFESHLHFHPEIEITEILHGHGYRIIGEHQEEFAPNDLVLIGSRTYHGYYGYQSNTPIPQCAHVLQFDATLIAEASNHLPELKPVTHLLQETRGGIVLTGKSRKHAHDMIDQLLNAQGVYALIHLLQILSVFVNAPPSERRDLTDDTILPDANNVDYQRLNGVFEHIHTHYHEAISLVDMAGQMGLSPSAFSRLFHKTTGRRFTRYVNEIRIGNVCRYLIDTDLPVYQIAQLCGYDNLSNFNRRFREIKGTTPHQYRQYVQT